MHNVIIAGLPFILTRHDRTFDPFNCKIYIYIKYSAYYRTFVIFSIGLVDQYMVAANLSFSYHIDADIAEHLC